MVQPDDKVEKVKKEINDRINEHFRGISTFSGYPDEATVLLRPKYPLRNILKEVKLKS